MIQYTKQTFKLKKMEIKNLKEAEELIKKYRDITIGMIKNANLTPNENNHFKIFGERVANNLLGFGSTSQCLLCQSTTENTYSGDCSKCIYSSVSKTSYACFNASTSLNRTYRAIQFSANPKSLKKAFEARADLIEEIISKIK